MRATLLSSILILLILSCAPKKTDTSATDSVATTALPTGLNQLSEQQKADGWKLLFDGQTLNGWRYFKNKEGLNWEVADGSIHRKESQERQSDLITNDQFGNFELAWDWKIASKANSGVMFHVTEEFDLPYASGPEYQLIDDVNYPGELKDLNKTGANYDLHVAENKTLNPAGEWNSSKIVVNGSHVEHWLNGTKVLEYELWSDDWKKRVAASKWKDFPGYGLSKTGHIDLQDHGHEAWFRNIMIKEL